MAQICAIRRGYRAADPGERNRKAEGRKGWGLRFHGTRLDVFLRAEIPTFALHPDDPDLDDTSYGVPISLMASYSFE